MVDIHIKNGEIFVKSEYDRNIVTFMRSRPKRFWNTTTREWKLPESDLDLLIASLSDYEYNIRYDDSDDLKQDSKNTNIQNSIPDWYEFKTKPFQHQIDGVNYGLQHPKFLLADEQGCIDGDALIDLVIEKQDDDNTLVFDDKIKLSDLYDLFSEKSCENLVFRTHSYIFGYFTLNDIVDVVYSGKKEVFSVYLSNGSCLNATADHEFLTVDGFVQLEELFIGDMVICYTSRNTPESCDITRIEKIGVKDTYDIKMQAPFHNFCANKIVVHNCGKSKQMLDLSQILKKESNIKHTLIIACVNSLKYNWQAEVEKHTNDKGYILGTRYLKNGREIIGSNEDRLSDIKDIGKGGQIDDYYYIITNIETLRYNKSIKVTLKTKKNGVQRFKKQTVFPIVEALQEQIDAGNINMIIADEIHKCKSENSLQGRALLALDCDYKAALTGTPVMNQPIDLYTVLNWLGFEEHSAFAFKKHYCIMGGFGQHQIVGYKNLPELQSILDKCMLRRLKSDVLDLPEKIYINDYVEMTKSQIKLYDEVRNNLIENIDKIKLSPNPLVQLIRLRQVTGNPSILSSSINDNPKFSRMCEIIEDAIENGGKVLVFSNWTDVIEPAYELVKSMKYKKDGKDKRYNPAIYTGQNKDVREQEKDRFMTDPDCKVLLGTMGAMGTGLTLTAANTVIFLDEPWNRAIKDQCEDRVHRIGTKESPNIITIMCKGTIDERINDLVYKKGKMSDVLIDKEEDMTRNPKIVNYLLSLD